MIRVSPYLKMRVLGAIEFAPGNSYIARIRHVSTMVFTDEDGRPFQFTWRTIQTWHSRYKKDGVTAMKPRSRSDKGCTRKVAPEAVLEAIEHVMPGFHGDVPNMAAIYRACIEQGLLHRDEIAPNTFRRMVKTHELLKNDKQATGKRRLAFAKAHANEMWQADTMVGPYVKNGSAHTQARLIAFIDDASRVCCHGEFFLAENTDSLIKALRSALYKRGIPESMYVDNGSIYTSKEITQICARLGCLLCHAPVRDGAAKGKVERFFRTVRQDIRLFQIPPDLKRSTLCEFRAFRTSLATGNARNLDIPGVGVSHAARCYQGQLDGPFDLIRCFAESRIPCQNEFPHEVARLDQRRCPQPFLHPLGRR